MVNHGDAIATKPETFQEAKQRSSFDAIRRQLKNLVSLRLVSTDPSIRRAAEQWKTIVEEAVSK